LEEIETRVQKNERVLVTTLTKRMAEELNDYLGKLRIKTAYIHSDVDTLERIRILDDLRAGIYDVLIGVNLLREGLDLPEVSLVAILDADKEGFLRSHRSLTQTVGRAARNLGGKVIMYADKITDSMQQTIDETERRRSIQLAYNEEHGITPSAIIKARNRIIGLDVKVEDDTSTKTRRGKNKPAGSMRDPEPIPYESEYKREVDIAADPVITYMTRGELERCITSKRSEMLEAAKRMEFMEAARLRDEVLKLEDVLKNMKSTDE
ncbi:MAG: UvrB/UvrC motif-containing protein, partial [Paramuribaculum sp.]|nr:UvrB/UvrC motif-containing protein [Paramuribaculum sp.]